MTLVLGFFGRIPPARTAPREFRCSQEDADKVGINVVVTAAQQSRDWVDYAVISLNLIGVIVVGIYTYYAKKQNELTEKTLILGRRSWLIITDLNAPVEFLANEPWHFSAKIKNCGGVPATEVVSNIGTMFSRSPAELPNELVSPDKTVIGAEIIAPGHSSSKGTLRPNIFPVVLIDAIQNGDVALYLYWSVEYRDVLSRDEEIRRSSACWRFEPEVREWVAAEKHNTAE
jgi:hypothetical protein